MNPFHYQNLELRVRYDCPDCIAGQLPYRDLGVRPTSSIKTYNSVYCPRCAGTGKIETWMPVTDLIPCTTPHDH